MHWGGQTHDLEKIVKIKNKFNCNIVEDACHALGSKYIYNGKIYNVGCCIHSDICIFSLHPLKTITSGEGGIVATNNLDIFNRLTKLKNSGIDRKDYKKKLIFPIGYMISNIQV